MKRKVRVKSLPKAQTGFNNIPSQGIKPYDIYSPLGSMPKAITPNMMGLNVPTKQQWGKQNGQLSMTGDFFKRKKDFGIPTYDPSIPGSSWAYGKPVVCRPGRPPRLIAHALEYGPNLA